MWEVIQKKVLQWQFLLGRRKASGYPDLRIAITYYCNNDCSYCSYQSVKDQKKFMAVNDFARILEWLKKQNKKWIVITGGEPLAHPDIYVMLEHAATQGFACYVQTNGLLIDEKLAAFVKGKKIYFIVNVNLDETFQPVSRRVQFVKKKLVLFRYNIGHENMGYSDLFRLARTCFVPVRFGHTVPAFDKKNEHFTKDDVFIVKEKFARFLEAAKKARVLVHLARPIPQCIYTEEEWSVLAKKYGFKSRCLIGDQGNYASRAIVNPDLSVYVCYGGFSCAGSLFDFSILEDLSGYFRDGIDKMRVEPLIEKCKTCRSFSDSTCQGGCLVYKS